VGDARQELATILREARALLALPNNDFAWSSWADAGAALAEVDGLVAALDAGRLPSRLTVAVLFAPTGPIQEVSLSSGWADEFLALAARCDAAVEAAYHASWWRRLLNRRVWPRRRTR
jgi:nucleotide-binding universal stress UspA family protein